MSTLEQTIKRKAIYINAGLGSLYDQYQDQIVRVVDEKSSHTEKPKLADCEFIHGEISENDNLLQLIGVEDDSRLNILLGLVEKTKLTSIIDYPYPINEYTRFLHYTYTRKIRNRGDSSTLAKRSRLNTVSTNPTYMVTTVSWGFEFVAILQLPHVKDDVEQIDNVLGKLSSHLKAIGRQKELFRLDEKDKDILQKIYHTKIYLDIDWTTSMKTINELCENIHLLQYKSHHRPIRLELNLISSTSLTGNGNRDAINSSDTTCKKHLEDYLLHLLKSINYVKSFLAHPISPSMHQDLKELHNAVSTRYSAVQNQYEKEIHQWREMVPRWRNNEISISEIENMLQDEQSQTFRRTLDELVNDLKHLETKEKFINDLQQKHFQYHNVSKDAVNSPDDVSKVVEKLIRNGPYDRVLYSSDQLNKDKPVEFQQKLDQLVAEYQNNTNLRLVYVDFSSCTCHLLKTDVLTKENINKTKLTSTTSIGKKLNQEYVNVLLLGESGVGKSTFINAFVNYLRFQSMKDAESSKPEVIIPVSFLITTGHNFEEHIVKFGDLNENSNEDFKHLGQSVTQRCQSYEFNLHDHHGKKLRIIDTPGFGDTRGLDQDDRNMQHVFEYLTEFPHLNAICFLLKPNLSRLTNFFRTCLLQLQQFLNPNIRRNIVFCFTNARTTFYSPGDTGPLLRSMLNSLPSKDIPFGKANTFCFDNEAFRYLVALRGGIVFNELDREEYEKSWLISVKESNRMIEYICQNLRMCYIGKRLESLQNTQGTILSMVDSMLATIRNIFRLMVSFQTVTNEQTSANGTLEPKTSNNSTHRSKKRMESHVETLSDACLVFAQFLINTNQSTKTNDPFFIRLTQMVDQQEQIYASNTSEVCSKELLNSLSQQKDNYEWKMKAFESNSNDIDLSAIEERIGAVKKILDTHKQTNSTNDAQNIADPNKIVTIL